MKRQMKIAAVVSATALLAIGASITSMAAAKNGTWKNEDGVWYCYDKDGDVYENEFCLDGNQEFYVGDDGAIVYSQWAEIGEYMYYIDSKGQAAKNCWKLLVPHNDEDAEAEWYYFQANGKMAESKKLVIEGNTYFFNEDGSVIYGWVNAEEYKQADAMSWEVEVDGDDVTRYAVYTDEVTGARVSKDWINTYEPGTTDEEKEDDNTKTYDYYIKSNSKAQIGMAKNIEGETFFFDANGRQLKGWILETAANTYVEIDGEGHADGLSVYAEAGKDIYFGCAVDGHAKKGKWIKEWKNTQYYAADTDNAMKHFWVEKDGTVFVPTEATLTDSNALKFADATEYNLAANTDGADAIEIKTIDKKQYAFNANGEMVTGLYQIDSTGETFYFDATNGNKVSGNVTLTDEYGETGKFLFSTSSADKFVGVTGTKNGKLYKDGLLITAKDAKYAVVEVAGDYYIVNASGSVQTTKKVYKDSDVEIIDAEELTFDTTTSTTAKGHIDATEEAILAVADIDFVKTTTPVVE